MALPVVDSLEINTTGCVSDPIVAVEHSSADCKFQWYRSDYQEPEEKSFFERVGLGKLFKGKKQIKVEFPEDLYPKQFYPIEGATAHVYVPTAADEYCHIRVIVTPVFRGVVGPSVAAMTEPLLMRAEWRQRIDNWYRLAASNVTLGSGNKPDFHVRQLVDGVATSTGVNAARRTVTRSNMNTLVLKVRPAMIKLRTIDGRHAGEHVYVESFDFWLDERNLQLIYIQVHDGLVLEFLCENFEERDLLYFTLRRFVNNSEKAVRRYLDARQRERDARDGREEREIRRMEREAFKEVWREYRDEYEAKRKAEERYNRQRYGKYWDPDAINLPAAK